MPTDPGAQAPPSREGQTLQELYAELRAATKRFHDAISERLEPGATVYIEPHMTPVTVVRTSWDRVQVHNEESDRTYWVYIYRLEGMGHV